MPPDFGLLLTRQETFFALVQLFMEADRAHQRAFLAANGHDPEWPRRYAEHLAPRMEALLGRSFDVQQLARQLRDLEEQRKVLGPAPEWPAFYAGFFLSR